MVWTTLPCSALHITHLTMLLSGHFRVLGFRTFGNRAFELILSLLYSLLKKFWIYWGKFQQTMEAGESQRKAAWL